MLSFEYPWLLLLLPLPWMARKLLRPVTVEDAALKAPFFSSWQSLSGSRSQGTSNKRWQLVTLWLIWLLLTIAASKPQWVGEPVSLPASGRDLLMAVDISGSMKIQDMKWKDETINRLTLVKIVVSDFVKRRENDRLGLVLFGTQAYLQAPLTFDRDTVNQLLIEAQLGFAGEKTAIGDAIGLSVKRLRKRPENHRVLVLLTDGANTEGEIEPRKAAELAAQAGVTIYTIGIGADEMEVSGIFGFGKRRYNPSADLDEDTLNYIADTTGGKYFRARNSEELEQIYQTLDALEPVEQDEATFRPTTDLFHWPLGSAMILLGVLMASRRLEKFNLGLKQTP